MSDGRVDYAGGVPSAYACGGCRASGVKLWRQYQTFANHVVLLCAPCACADQKVSDVVGEDGKVPLMAEGPQRIDQIGWLVPAVPTEDGETFWGYTSVPRAGVDWWNRLPTRQSNTAERIAELERAAETSRAEHAEVVAELAEETLAHELTREAVKAAVDEWNGVSGALGLATARIRELEGAFAEMAALFPPVPAQSDDDDGEPHTCGTCFAIVLLDEGCEADPGDPCHHCAQEAYAEARAIVARIEKVTKGTT